MPVRVCLCVPARRQVHADRPFSSFYKEDRRDACPTGEER